MMISRQEIDQIIGTTECFEPTHGLFGCISFREGTVFVSRSPVGVLASYRQQRRMPIPGINNYPCKMVWDDYKIGCMNIVSGEKGCGVIDPDFNFTDALQNYLEFSYRYRQSLAELKFDVMAMFGFTSWEQYQEIVRRERKDIFRRVYKLTNISEFVRFSFEGVEETRWSIPEKIYLKEFVEESYNVPNSSPKVQSIPVVGVKSKRRIIFKD